MGVYESQIIMKNINQKEVIELKDLIPFLSNEELQLLLSQLEPILRDHDYKKVATNIDLEQLQITYYPSLFSHRPELPEMLKLIQNSGIYDQHELDFLTLRSLVNLSWPKPSDQKHLEFMLKTEMALQVAMRQMAKAIKNRHAERQAWLPYWARLAHFNLTRDLPPSIQSEIGPDGIPCILLRSQDINAHTFPISTGQAIVLDYALEPFLKNMNAFLHSYYASRELSGPKRIFRAFKELLPRVLFYKGLISAYASPPFSLLFGDDNVFSLVKNTTDSQISFLIAHEIGHIILNHPGSHTAFPVTTNKPENTLIYLKHEQSLEFEADSFAMDWGRSRVINNFRYFLHPKRSKNKKKIPSTISSLNQTLSEYGHFYLSIETLFLIIDFLESFYEKLASSSRSIPSFQNLNTHPNPQIRWERIQKHCVYDIPISSDFSKYSKELLSKVLEYTDTLSKDIISDSIKEFRQQNGN